jgi:hypothetical protein
MQIEDLTKAYGAKTDEELLQLATESEQLTPEGHAALRVELAKRRIDSTKPLIAAEETQQAGIEQPSTYFKRVFRDSHSVSGFLAEVFRVYHDHFWLHVKLSAPSVVLGWIAVFAGGYEVREIVRHVPGGAQMRSHSIGIFEIGLINLTTFLVSWLAVAFSFGSVCVTVRRTSGGIVPSVLDAFAEVRERIGPFLRVSLALFFLLLIAFAVAMGFSFITVFWVFDRFHPSHFAILLLSYGSMGTVLVVFSRFALAIPAVLLDNYRVGQAIFRSDELTQGKWLTLTALLGKSLLGGYLVGMCPFWLAHWILPSIPMPSWFPWILTAASIAGVTVVEAAMFIGFALLYLETSALSSLSSEALTSQLA